MNEPLIILAELWNGPQGGPLAWVWMGMVSGGTWLAVSETDKSTLDKPTIKTAMIFALMGPLYFFTAIVLLPFYFIYRVCLQVYRDSKSTDSE